MKPILFNTEMVRAILDKRKTVTSRVVKPQPTNPRFNNIGWLGWDDGHGYKMCQPYCTGDILYVRETWCEGETFSESGRYFYRADDDYCPCRWHPSIHMPKEAARLFLRVTKVWLQQLKDVTEGDAKAEGFDSRDKFCAAISKMYPDCTEDSWLWVNEFERISKEMAELKPSTLHD